MCELSKRKEACRKNDWPLCIPFSIGLDTQQSSHDFLNPEHCHHQKFAVRFIVLFFYFGSKVKHSLSFCKTFSRKFYTFIKHCLF